MISIDNLDGTVHWVAFRGNRRTLEVYDTMTRSRKYKQQINFILTQKFIELNNVNFEIGWTPQPRGGIIPDEDRIMKWALENDRPMGPWEHSVIMGYESQHQFCYLESYMWLIDRHRHFTESTTPRQNLEWIKRNAAFLDPPADFFYVYDPEKDERCKIEPF